MLIVAKHRGAKIAKNRGSYVLGCSEVAGGVDCSSIYLFSRTGVLELGFFVFIED